MNIFDRIRNYFDGILRDAFENEGGPTKAEFSKLMAAVEPEVERNIAAHRAMAEHDPPRTLRADHCTLYLDDDGQCAIHGRDCN